MNLKSTTALSAAALTLAVAMPAAADQVFVDDVIVQGSLCAGLDCANGLNFGFDTLIIKENNTRLFFDDTSASASFPSNDWRFTANSSDNGGASYMSIDDATAGRQLLVANAGAQANAIYISGNNVGFGTASPVLELHAVDGDSPSLRLEQDGSNGWTPQTWDIAGNETNFFVRDVTGGSDLPLRIRAGAPDDAFYIAANGNIGLNTDNPDAALHVRRTNGTAQIHVQETSDTGIDNVGGGLLYAQISSSVVRPRTVAGFANMGDVEVNWINSNSTGNPTWKLAHLNDMFQILSPAVAGPEFQLSNNGNLKISGTLTTGSNTAYPDYVFEEGYELMPLSELDTYIATNGHLPKIPKAEEVAETGINITQMQISLLEKVEELTLYTLQQQARIDALEAELSTR